MTSRAITLQLDPVASGNCGAQVETYTYKPAERIYRAMAESVTLSIESGCARVNIELTADEARVLANQLLQVADTADEHRAAREADDALQASFDEISEEMRNAEELGGTGCYYSHPDIHYVPADQVQAKARELHAAGVKRFMVLPDPYPEAA